MTLSIFKFCNDWQECFSLLLKEGPRNQVEDAATLEHLLLKLIEQASPQEYQNQEEIGKEDKEDRLCDKVVVVYELTCSLLDHLRQAIHNSVEVELLNRDESGHSPLCCGEVSQWKNILSVLIWRDWFSFYLYYVVGLFIC